MLLCNGISGVLPALTLAATLRPVCRTIPIVPRPLAVGRHPSTAAAGAAWHRTCGITQTRIGTPPIVRSHLENPCFLQRMSFGFVRCERTNRPGRCRHGGPAQYNQSGSHRVSNGHPTSHKPLRRACSKQICPRGRRALFRQDTRARPAGGCRMHHGLHQPGASGIAGHRVRKAFQGRPAVERRVALTAWVGVAASHHGSLARRT